MMPEISDEERKREGLKPYCPCKSGNYRTAQHDARGIFLCYTCSVCEREKLGRYRPDVLMDPNYPHVEPIDED
jgi:hypothetical protein